ncbi:hypothetical protein [Flavobacterium gilvum]|uniref:DUF4197 domain-containing protein n=1 Tax=Flavobacterium gilvum TaxID=1492737 RepID=A0AAC9I4E5_9FLAO|nr:hypothetical protein [Flavobacterium gilvum]AOW09920.1 hypothetical protein EM308_10590 [Flavobacterium gilvum]KFC59624.1 hypothetical protein FEM08_16160 [Flavobacterium gilvum]
MKKKLLITAVLLGTFSFSNAQSIGDITKAANTATSAANAANTVAKSFNVATIANEVMALLGPKLKLSQAQIPAVTALVNETLNKKKNILPTLTTDKAGYTAKMTTNRQSFLTKMKNTISKEQFTALTALLPKSAAAVANPLVQLLY